MVERGGTKQADKFKIVDFLPNERLLQIVTEYPNIDRPDSYEYLQRTFRSLLSDHGNSMDLPWQFRPVGRLLRKTLITRAAFEFPIDHFKSRFLIVETDSMYENVHGKENLPNDPLLADINIWPLTKKWLDPKNPNRCINITDQPSPYSSDFCINLSKHGYLEIFVSSEYHTFNNVREYRFIRNPSKDPVELISKFAGFNDV